MEYRGPRGPGGPGVRRGPRGPRGPIGPIGPGGPPPNGIPTGGPYIPGYPRGPPPYVYAQPVYAQQKSATEEVFSKVESVGQFAAGAGAVIATILAIGGIIGGCMVIKQSDAQVESTATARAPSRCSQERVTTSTRGGTTTRFETRCTTDVEYTAEGATRQASVETPTRYSEGDTLSVYYVPGSNESQVSATRTPRLAGYIIIGVSVFVFLASWIWYAATKKWEGAAALGGFSSIAGVFRH